MSQHLRGPESSILTTSGEVAPLLR